MGALLAAIVLASACTDSGGGSSTTSSVNRSTTTEAGVTQDVGRTMDEALGGTQAVQDFVIHIDMSIQTDKGPVGFYQEVLDRAESGVGEPVELAGGFTFTTVDSLQGKVIDDAGKTLPSISLDFGLLAVGRDSAIVGSEELAGELRAMADEELAQTLLSLDPSDASLLVELVTADYTEARTHAGPGDRSAIDLTFVRAISPGDSVTSIHVFGQTLPGDPVAEDGLSPQDLFSYRWNQGLVRVLGAEGGAGFVIDATAEAVEGSTLLTRDIKEDLLNRGAFAIQQGRAQNLASEIESQLGEGPILVSVTEDGPVVVVKDEDEGKGLLVSAGDGPFDERTIARFDLDDWAAAMVLLKTLDECREAAEYLNMRNQSGGIPLSEIREGDYPDETATDDTTIDNGGSTTTTGAKPPGPVSCYPPNDTPALPKLPSGGAWGDPHIRTIDGNFYDNMATGEFLAFDNGVAVIQMRTEPWPGEDSVSFATALAFRVGDHTLSVHLGGSTWIDGEEAELTRGETIAVGDGEMLRWEGGWVLVWPDGTVARVYLRAAALILVVTPSDRPSVGMLGDNDGDPDNDLVTRSGDQLAPDADDDFDTFYPTYIDSWRTTDDESLFHYEPGESTSSFTIQGFPAAPSTADVLDPEVRTDAEEACASVGVTGGQTLESCVLDVGLTGDTSMAYDSFIVETSTASPDSETTDGGDIPQTSTEGGSVVTIGGLKVEFGPEPPVQDPNGPSPKWQCEVTDGSFFATSRFDESPTRKYEVTIEYLDAAASNTGEERFTLIIKLNAVEHAWVLNWNSEFADAIDSLSLDGSTLSASGVAYLNEPTVPGVSPFSALPDNAELQPFHLEATCDQ
jgi:hypothetical protein